jgi:hypothetical protein
MDKANGVRAKRLSVFSISAFQLFSFSLQRGRRVYPLRAFTHTPTHPHTPPLPLPKTGPKNILIIIHFPLANFVSAGVIYPHRKKVGFGPGGLNPRKSKALTVWTEWEYPHHDILKQVSR